MKVSLKTVGRRLPLELLAWLGILVVLAVLNPNASYPSLCLFKKLGIPFCPGCGLGRSISYLLHGDPVRSFQSHPLGLAAVGILLVRIFSLLKNLRKQFWVWKPSPL